MDDALSYDAWANADDDVDYDPDLDFPIALVPGGASFIADHNEVARQEIEIARTVEWYSGAVVPDDPAAAPVRAAKQLPTPRLAGDIAVGRGVGLRQRTRHSSTEFSTDDELRVFLASETSLDFADLVRPTPRGRLSRTEAARREELARLVGLARARGAGYEALARVLGRSVSTVHALAR